jgi:hypothetical protein
MTKVVGGVSFLVLGGLSPWAKIVGSGSKRGRKYGVVCSECCYGEGGVRLPGIFPGLTDRVQKGASRMVLVPCRWSGWQV